MLDKISVSDKETQELIDTFKVNQQFQTSFLRDGKIYSYPYLYSVLDDSEKSKLEITKDCKFYSIITSVDSDENFYIFKGFTFIDEISFYDFEDIVYSIDVAGSQITKCMVSEYTNDTDGISTIVNNGYIIKIPKTHNGEVSITISYKGLTKVAYFCSINNGVDLDFNKLQIDVNKHLSKLIKFEVLSDDMYKVYLTINLYKNLPEIELIYKKKSCGITFSKKKMSIGKEHRVDANSLFKMNSLLQNNSYFYVYVNNVKNQLTYQSCLGNIYYKNNFYLDKFGNIKHREFVFNDLKWHLKNIVWQSRSLNKLARRILNFGRILPVEKDDEILQKCLEFEKKSGILNLPIIKTYGWEIGRFFILSDIDNLFNGSREMYAGKKRKISKLSKTELGAMLYNLKDEKRNPLVNKPKQVTLVIDNLRKTDVNGQCVDTASYYYVQKLYAEKGEKLMVCDSDYLYEHQAEEDYRSYLDGYNIYARMKRMNNFVIPKFKDKDLFRDINRTFKECTGVSYNFSKRLQAWTRRYIFEYTYSFHLFNVLQPEELYVVGPYKQWMYHVSESFGTKTFEFQYSAIESGHLGYAYDKSSHLKADNMIVWSDFWKKELEKYNEYKYIVHPNNFFYSQKKLCNQNGCCDRYDMLFLSQNAIGEEMLEIAYKIAAQNTNISILYRLHPHEEISLYKLYKKCQKLKNFKFSQFSEENVYESISKSKHVVGVYSTSVIESFAMSKSVILLNLPGIEYMKGFIDEFNEINVVNNVEELLEVHYNTENSVNEDYSAIIFGNKYEV